MTIKTKKPHVVLVIISILLIVLGSAVIWEYLYRQKAAAADKLRFESALTDMNKFFDALGTNVTNRTVERTCDYGVGPWGDQGDLNCTVIIKANYVRSEGMADRLKELKMVLGWNVSNESTSPDEYLYWVGGGYKGLDCFGRLNNDYSTVYYCHARTAFQHYQRVER